MVTPPRPPSRRKWLLAVGLGVVSAITGTLGSFMPIKAVFILAADDVPTFFPQLIVDAGPVAAGLALLVLAGIFQIVSKITANMTATLSGPDKKMASFPPSKKHSGKNHSITLLPLGDFTSVTLIFVLAGLASAVSSTLLILILLWLVGSVITLAIIIQRRDRRPPYPTGRAEFTAEFKKWVANSALWAAVGAAIITLIVDYPTLGLTGILLGAILMLRMQRAVADIGHLLLPQRGADKKSSQPAVTPPVKKKLRDNPLDFIASPNGQRLLKLSLDEYGLSRDKWRIIGVPSRVQVSLLVDDPAGGKKVLLRLFASTRTDLHQRELDFRHSRLPSTPFTHSTAESIVIAGLPAILVRFTEGFAADPTVSLSSKEAGRWQIAWEQHCLVETATQDSLQEFPVPDPKDFLAPHLGVMSGVRGDHRDLTREVLEEVDTLRNRYFDGPRVYSLGGSLSARNLIVLGSDYCEPIDCTAVSAAMHGTTWGSEAVHGAAFRDLNADSPSLADTYQRARLRKKLHDVGSAGAKRDPVALAKTLKALRDG